MAVPARPRSTTSPNQVGPLTFDRSPCRPAGWMRTKSPLRRVTAGDEYMSYRLTSSAVSFRSPVTAGRSKSAPKNLISGFSNQRTLAIRSRDLTACTTPTRSGTFIHCPTSTLSSLSALLHTISAGHTSSSSSTFGSGMSDELTSSVIVRSCHCTVTCVWVCMTRKTFMS